MMWVYVTFILSAIIAVIGFLLANICVWMKVVPIIVIVALCAAQFMAYRDQVRDNQTLKQSGKLENPSATLLSPSQNLYPTLKIGNSNTFFNYQGQAEQPLFAFIEDAALTIWVENGQMKLSTKIRDKNGNLIAEIIANEWKTKQETNWDRNYNSNALEVKDSTGEVVLQVIMHEDCIQFAAKMYSSKGDGFAIGSKVYTEEDILQHAQGASVIVAAADGPKEVTVGDTVAESEIRPNPPGIPLEFTIDPIFRYPSDLHLGELLNQ